MNSLIIGYIIIGSILRIVGLSVSIDFFIKKKEIKFIFFMIMWIFYFLSEFILLFFVNVFINTLFSTIGFIVTPAGVLSYFTKVKTKLVIEICITTIVIYLSLFFLLSPDIASNFAMITFIVAFLIEFFIPLFNFSNFKELIGKSIIWYYAVLISCVIFLPISFFITIQGSIFNVYYLKNNILIFIYFSGVFATQLLFLIFLIHFEYNHSNYMNLKLKDSYSHDLGNILQSIQLSFGILSQNKSNEGEKLNLFKLIEKKCKEASDLINKIREF
jgi:hypothetical protein